MRTPHSLSMVVPMLNEGPIIGTFLRHVRELAPEAEVIVVDGGSVDGPREMAALLADHTISTIRGRAVQMNAGAAVAANNVLGSSMLICSCRWARRR
jgi:glycosyltransferase involved in cell wall biosynthesis